MDCRFFVVFASNFDSYLHRQLSDHISQQSELFKNPSPPHYPLASEALNDFRNSSVNMKLLQIIFNDTFQ